MTDPPIVGDLGVAVARRFRAPLLVISEDVFPEIATELGRLTNPVLVRVLGGLVGYYLKRADHIVAIGERMRERLIVKGAAAERITVIPNWVDTTTVVPGRVTTSGLASRASSRSSSSCTRGTSATRRISTTSSARRRSARSRRSRRPDHRRRRALRRDQRPRGRPRRRQGPVHAVPAARGAAAVAREREPSLRRPREGPVGVRRPESALRDPRGGKPVIVAADADSETARLVEEVGCGVALPPTVPISSQAQFAMRTAAARPRGDGKARPRIRRARRGSGGRAAALPLAGRPVDRRVKILQVTPYFAPAWAYGGPPRVMHDYAAGLVARGHAVDVFTTDVLDQARAHVRCARRSTALASGAFRT